MPALDDYRFSLKVHDRFQVEMKLGYPVSKEKSKERIRLETFLFLPPSLGVHAKTYTKDKFYQDLQIFTRYATPGMSLDELLDLKNELSPLTRLNGIKATGSTGLSDEATKKIIFELRVLVCIARARILDSGRRIRALIEGEDGAHGGRALSPPSAEEIGKAVKACEALLERSESIIQRAREIKRGFYGPGGHPEVLKAFEFEDEAMSIHLEEVCGRLYRAFGKCIDRFKGAAFLPELEAMAERLAETMHAEEARRLQACYPSQVDASGTQAGERANEYYLYRGSVLKKFAQSILFLTVHSGQGSRKTFYFMNAVAAMLAMLAYMLLVLLFIQNPQSTSTPVIVLFVIAYAFKDRIKEGLRAYFSERMTGILKDRENKLQDRGPGMKIVGRVAEGFSFVASDHVPGEILKLRGRDDLAMLAEEGAPESVIKYQRDVTLESEQIHQIHKRIAYVDEIIRYSVRSLLYRMDEPKKRLVILKGEEKRKLRSVRGIGLGADPVKMAPKKDYKTQIVSESMPSLPPLKRVRASKVYHINMLFRISTQNEKGEWEKENHKFRVVLSRDGIKRVEAVKEGDAKVLLPPQA